MSSGIELEKLIVRIVAEANDYLKPLEKIVKETEAAAERIESTAKKMADSIGTKLPDIAANLDKHIVAPLRNVDAQFRQSTLVAEQSINRINAAAQRAAAAVPASVYSAPTAMPSMPSASPRTSPVASGGRSAAAPAAPSMGGGSRADDIIADWDRQVAAMRASLDKTAASAAAATVAKHTLARAISGVGTAASIAAPFVAMLNVDAGLATMGVGNLAIAAGEAGGAAAPAAAGLATFTAAVVGTTYAISGVEGVKNIIPNILEGTKYVLYAVTAGYVDLTAKTQAAAQGQVDFARMTSSAQSQASAMIEERVNLVRGLKSEIAAMADVSEKAEEAFKANKLGRFGQLGGKPESAQYVGSDIDDHFDARRNKDLIASLEKEAGVYKFTREQLAMYQLAQNNASASDIVRVKALFEKMDAVDAAAAAERQAKSAAEDAARDAKRAADAAQREVDHVLREGESVTKSLRTEAEKRADEIKNIERLFRAGAIDQTTYDRAMTQATSPAVSAERHARQIVNPGPLDDLEYGSANMVREFAQYKSLRAPVDVANNAGVQLEAKQPKLAIAEAKEAGKTAVEKPLQDKVNDSTLKLIAALDRNTASKGDAFGNMSPANIGRGA